MIQQVWLKQVISIFSVTNCIMCLQIVRWKIWSMNGIPSKNYFQYLLCKSTWFVVSTLQTQMIKFNEICKHKTKIISKLEILRSVLPFLSSSMNYTIMDIVEISFLISLRFICLYWAGCTEDIGEKCRKQCSSLTF